MRCAVALLLSGCLAHSCADNARVTCMEVEELPDGKHGEGDWVDATGWARATPAGEVVFCLPNHRYHKCQDGQEPCCADGSDPLHGARPTTTEAAPMVTTAGPGASTTEAAPVATTAGAGASTTEAAPAATTKGEDSAVKGASTTEEVAPMMTTAAARASTTAAPSATSTTKAHKNCFTDGGKNWMLGSVRIEIDAEISDPKHYMSKHSCAWREALAAGLGVQKDRVKLRVVVQNGRRLWTELEVPFQVAVQGDLDQLATAMESLQRESEARATMRTSLARSLKVPIRGARVQPEEQSATTNKGPNLTLLFCVAAAGSLAAGAFLARAFRRGKASPSTEATSPTEEAGPTQAEAKPVEQFVEEEKPGMGTDAKETGARDVDSVSTEVPSVEDQDV